MYSGDARLDDEVETNVTRAGLDSDMNSFENQALKELFCLLAISEHAIDVMKRCTGQGIARITTKHAPMVTCYLPDDLFSECVSGDEHFGER